MSSTDKEMVNHPSHYNTTAIETIVFIADMGPDIIKGFCVGSAIKYAHRAGLKPGNPAAQDYRKAAWYLNWLADYMEQPEKVMKLSRDLVAVKEGGTTHGR